MTSKNILIALGAILLIIATMFFTKTNTPSERTVIEDTAITTEEIVETIPDSIEVPKKKSPLRFSVESGPGLQEKKDLGPRLPATGSPLAALQYAAEAMQAGDLERSLSYFSEDVKDSYRTSFVTGYEGKMHPVLGAFLSGTTDPVELIQPEYGLYEIAIYQNGSTVPYRAYFRFDGSVGEFVITEG